MLIFCFSPTYVLSQGILSKSPSFKHEGKVLFCLWLMWSIKKSSWESLKRKIHSSGQDLSSTIFPSPLASIYGTMPPFLNFFIASLPASESWQCVNIVLPSEKSCHIWWRWPPWNNLCMSYIIIIAQLGTEGFASQDISLDVQMVFHWERDPWVENIQENGN